MLPWLIEQLVHSLTEILGSFWIRKISHFGTTIYTWNGIH